MRWVKIEDARTEVLIEEQVDASVSSTGASRGGEVSGGGVTAGNPGKLPAMSSNASALLGGMCLLPFLILNAVVAKRIEPVFSFIRPGPHTSSFEIILLTIVLACVAVGACIAAGPLLSGGAHRSRRVYLLSGTISALMLVVFVVLTTALGSEIYRCEVLGIPNCD